MVAKDNDDVVEMDDLIVAMVAVVDTFVDLQQEKIIFFDKDSTKY